MNLYKGTYYTAGILSLIGILLVGFIIQGSTDLIGTLLYIAYIILALIISFVLFFTLKNITSNKDLLLNTTKVVGIFLGTALICYFVFHQEKKLH
jgi:VIT1/CCC1 family predicted Fe2+/Mn2+ transporter